MAATGNRRILALPETAWYHLLMWNRLGDSRCHVGEVCCATLSPASCRWGRREVGCSLACRSMLLARAKSS